MSDKIIAACGCELYTDHNKSVLTYCDFHAENIAACQSCESLKEQLAESQSQSLEYFEMVAKEQERIKELEGEIEGVHQDMAGASL